jgi:hypothetical protein
VRIGSVVVDCNNFAAMVTFWQEALSYVAREPAEDGWVVLRDPAGANVRARTGCTWTSTPTTRPVRSSGYWGSERPAIPATPSRPTTSSSSRTQRATCSA